MEGRHLFLENRINQDASSVKEGRKNIGTPPLLQMTVSYLKKRKKKQKRRYLKVKKTRQVFTFLYFNPNLKYFVVYYREPSDSEKILLVCLKKKK